jgi:lipoprotein-anchoring transpeptidase ErfK/SrfK
MQHPLRLFLAMALLVVLVMSTVPSTSAASPGIVVVSWGDTLATIAARNGTTVQAIIKANWLPSASFLYTGQRLIIPTSGSAPVSLPQTSNIYTVSIGDTLTTIAAKLGTTASEVMSANGLHNPDFIYIGQRLNVPGRSAQLSPLPGNAPAPLTALNPVRSAPTTGKWIDVDIGDQRTTAYLGTSPLKSVRVSTGVSYHPTPIGHYAIYTKVASQAMSGPGYYLPGVPWVMFFTGDYAIHGTYWHRNFGTPMSHGCVNLTIEDSKWFYDWAEIGTPVIVHP